MKFKFINKIYEFPNRTDASSGHPRLKLVEKNLQILSQNKTSILENQGDTNKSLINAQKNKGASYKRYQSTNPQIILLTTNRRIQIDQVNRTKQAQNVQAKIQQFFMDIMQEIYEDRLTNQSLQPLKPMIFKSKVIKHKRLIALDSLVNSKQFNNNKAFVIENPLQANSQFLQEIDFRQVILEAFCPNPRQIQFTSALQTSIHQTISRLPQLGEETLMELIQEIKCRKYGSFGEYNLQSFTNLQNLRNNFFSFQFNLDSLANQTVILVTLFEFLASIKMELITNISKYKQKREQQDCLSNFNLMILFCFQ